MHIEGVNLQALISQSNYAKFQFFSWLALHLSDVCPTMALQMKKLKLKIEVAESPAVEVPRGEVAAVVSPTPAARRFRNGASLYHLISHIFALLWERLQPTVHH